MLCGKRSTKSYFIFFNLLVHRSFPLDMAAFAIHIRQLLSKPKAKFGKMLVNNVEKTVPSGWLEPKFLEQFASSPSTVECRGSDKEVITLL